MHYKPTETFQYTNFYLCRAPGVTKGFIRREALSLFRTNSSKTMFEVNKEDFMSHLISRGYPVSLVKKHLGEDQFSDRHSAPTQKNQTARKKILPFVTQYSPALPGLKNILREIVKTIVLRQDPPLCKKTGGLFMYPLLPP